MLLNVQVDGEPEQPIALRQRLYEWRSPLREMSRQAGDFVVWFVFAIVIGGLSIWIFPVLRPHLDTTSAWLYTISGGSLGTFVTVLLANSLLTGVIQPAKQLALRVEEARRVAGAITVLLLIAQTMIIWLLDTPSGTPTRLLVFQIIIAVLAILMAVYHQCLRLLELQYPLSTVPAKEERTIERLGKDVDAKKETKKGEVL